MNKSFLVLFIKKGLLPWPTLDVLFATAGLWLAAPLTIARAGGWYDDYLFVRQAHFFLHGAWLGPFDSLTLIKGPLYPMFLAACAAGGVPVQAATQGVYLSGALLLARTAGRLAGSRGAASLCFAMMACNPACFDRSATMLMREPLYGGLTTLVLGLAARAFLCSGGTVWPALLGTAGAAFWLTREEGLVLIPPVLLMAAWRVWGHRSSWRSALAAPLMASSVAVALVLAIGAVNLFEYGVFRTNDLKAGAFPRAYGALVRIDPDHWRRLVPVARETRLRLYAVSPSAAELQPYLEGDSAHLTTDVDCAGEPRPACHDLDGAHFLFALRDAVTRAGHYASARDADRFYNRLAREIDDACARHALSCSGSRSGLWPQFSLRYAAPFARSLLRIAADMARLGVPHAVPVLSLMHGPDAAAYDDVLSATATAPADDLLAAPGWHVAGAFATAGPAARMVATGPSGTVVQSELRESADRSFSDALHRPPGQGQVFSGTIRCQPGDCRLTLMDAGGVLGSWPLATLVPGMAMNTPAATVFVGSVTPLQTYGAVAYRPSLRTGIMRACTLLLPALTALTALPALAWVALRTARDISCRAIRPLTVLLLALTLAVIGRVILLALLDATTVPVEFRYEAPATGALLCLVGLTLEASSPFLKKRTKKLSSVQAATA